MDKPASAGRAGLRSEVQGQCSVASSGQRVNRIAGGMTREDLLDAPMVDKHLHGPTRGHHRFTVASMVSRRAGRTFSDLACGTGVPSWRHADASSMMSTATHSCQSPVIRPRSARRLKALLLNPLAAVMGQRMAGAASRPGADGLDPEAGEAGPRRRQRCRRQASGAALPSEDHSGYPVGAVFVVDDLADHPQHEDGEEN
jgi:hypothetical protein